MMKLPLFLKVINSPFKLFKLKFYIGKTAIGVPYFYPRKWIEYTMTDCIENVTKSINNSNLVQKSFDEWLNYYKGYRKAIPKKIGFDFRDLGWKEKYNTYRFEYNPVWSFVFFGYQIAVVFIVPHIDHYWECFLAYYYETDRTKSKKERIEECTEKFPCVWTTHSGDKKGTVNYWKLILKKKYVK